MNFAQNNQIELKQTLESNAIDLHNAAASLSRWIEQKKQDSNGKMQHHPSGSEDTPGVRNLKYNLMQEEKRAKHLDKSNNNVKATSPTSCSGLSNKYDDTNTNHQTYAIKLKEKGNHCIKLERFEDAIMHYTNAINLNNSDPVFYCNRALCYLKLEKYDQCIDDCQTALKVDPTYIKAYYRRMQANEYLGKNKEAMADCKKILEIDSKNTEALACFQRLEKRLTANKCETISPPKINIDYNEELLKDKPPTMEDKKIDVKTEDKTIDPEINAIFYKDLGNSCVKKEKYDEAIMYYTQAIETFNSNPTFYCNRAFCHLKLKRFNQCISDCDAAIELDRKLVKAYYRRMLAYEALGKLAGAINDSNNVLSLDPKNTDAIRIRCRQHKSQINLKDDKLILKQKSVKLATNIQFIQKPPHARSTRPLKSIKVLEVEKKHISAESVTKIKINENVLQDAKSNDEISLRNPEKFVMEDIKINTKLVNRRENTKLIPSPPSTSASFHNAWKELPDLESKYLYLKKINATQINKLLGALFDSKLLTELLQILSTYYIYDNCPILEILRQIASNNEFKILKMLMDEQDKKALKRINEYMNSYHNNPEDFRLIAKLFDFDFD